MSEIQHNDIFLSAAQVRARYGGVSFMWIERRLKDDSGYPSPIKMGRLRFWRLADLEHWERAQATKSKQPKNAA